MTDRVMVVSAHCDDESFGCLGKLLKHKEAGDEFIFFWFAQARNTFSGAAKCRDFFNAVHWRFLDFADQHLDIYPLVELIRPIETIINRYHPSIVYIPFIADLNRDHRIVSEAAMIACRPYKENSPREVWMYEVQGTTELGFRQFNADKGVIIDSKQKEKLLKEWYQNELINGRECVTDYERFEKWPR